MTSFGLVVPPGQEWLPVVPDGYGSLGSFARDHGKVGLAHLLPIATFCRSVRYSVAMLITVEFSCQVFFFVVCGLGVFKKVCRVLFVLGLALAVALVLAGDRKVYIWVLVMAALIQVIGRVR